MKTVIDFLKAVDGLGCYAVYWLRGDPEDLGPCWEGSLFDTPWWVAELELDYEEAESHQPISFRENLGEEHNNRPGFVFWVKENDTQKGVMTYRCRYTYVNN